MSAINAQFCAESKSVQLEKTVKRDVLIKYQNKFQSFWKQSKCFEADPVESSKGNGKFFGTMAYPYMNGRLHLGHAFTISKLEFAAAYNRLKGKKVLFPMGFHCTGMPIQACADRLAREVELFGKNFERYQPEKETLDEKEEALAKIQSAKPKQALKSAPFTWQFQIMNSLGIPLEDISEFVNPEKWLTYFPEMCREDCNLLGLRVDWRRSMITTEVNPYYDSFVRWTMNRLKKQNLIKFGERYTIYSPKDGQPCLDHDRKDGEGLGVQEYTGIKLQILELPDQLNEKIKDLLQGSKLYMIAATLRPETMYGQTNCFVGPSIGYGIFKSSKSGEFFLCSRRSARNMSYQNLSPSRGVVEQVYNLKGRELIGALVKAPYSLLDTVRVLPMESVLENKGTGVVTSVPSDSPDDYATYMDLRKKAAYYNVDPKWMEADPIETIDTPSYGKLCAKYLIEELKISGPKDSANLAKAKELAYREGYHQGVLLLGKYAGKRVEESKPLIQADLISENLAFIYNEPEGKITSRSGDDCCVALCDQWYLDYGEEKWKRKALECVESMNFYSPETKNGFLGTLNWLNQWACSRSYGLGSKLPWDPQYLVESLSDSTVYMAYYTISHHLHSTINGSKPGDMEIYPNEMTDEVWEFIFWGGELPETTISNQKLIKLQEEFRFFYPLDVNISGKDLIPNHMTFSIYCHTALFPKQFWPRGARANGHLFLNGEKMSKSTGNFMTLFDACEKFGSDAVRIALADAGDGLEDANFEESTANSAILRLYNLNQWIEEFDFDSLRSGEKLFNDLAFENEINDLVIKAGDAFERGFYKEALLYSWYEMQKSRDWYRDVTFDVKMHKDVTLYWIRVQTILVSVFAPHWAERCWQEILKEKDSIQNAKFPEIKKVNIKYSKALEYIRGLAREIHILKTSQQKNIKKNKAVQFDPTKPNNMNIYVGTSWPEWQRKYVEKIQEHFDPSTKIFDDVEITDFAKSQDESKKGVQFVQMFMKSLKDEQRPFEEMFQRKLLFDEMEALQNFTNYVEKSANIDKIAIITISQEDGNYIGRAIDGTKVKVFNNLAEKAAPGKPTFYLYNPNTN